MNNMTDNVRHSASGAPAAAVARGTGLPSVAYWALVGAVGAFGVAGAMTIGIFFLGLALVLLILGLLLRIDASGMPGAFVGAALVPLYIAWLNRDGPGEICKPITDGISCTEQWSPWPFVGVAVVLALVGVVLLRLVRR